MAKKNYNLGQLDNIEFVVIFTRYQDKWVYSWHKKRQSFEHPGGHVEARPQCRRQGANFMKRLASRIAG